MGKYEDNKNCFLTFGTNLNWIIVYLEASLTAPILSAILYTSSQYTPTFPTTEQTNADGRCFLSTVYRVNIQKVQLLKRPTLKTSHSTERPILKTSRF